MRPHREGQGHLDNADDLDALAGLFSANWNSAKGRCDIAVALFLPAAAPA